MFGRGNAAIWCYKDMIPEGHPGSIGNHQVMVGIKAVTNGDVIAIIAPERRGKYRILSHAAQQLLQDLPLRFIVVGMELVIPIALVHSLTDFRFQLGIIASRNRQFTGTFALVSIRLPPLRLVGIAQGIGKLADIIYP